MTHFGAFLVGVIVGICTLPVAVLAGHMLKALAEDFGDGAQFPEPAMKALGRLAKEKPPIYRGTVRPNGESR